MKHRVFSPAAVSFRHLSFASAVVFGLFSNSAHAMTGPSNYWECTIDRLPKVTNDQEATAAKRQCRWDFTDFYWRRALPKDNGILGFSTKASECIEKEVVKTESRTARLLIREACIGNFPQ